MPNVFEDVPWPVNFLEFTLPLNIVNLDFLSAFVRSSCSLAVPFLDRFVLHMMLPPLLLSSVLAAFFLSKKVCIKSDEKLNRGKELLSQILILGVLFIYPGLATRIFSTWKCKSIQGVNGEVLAADFSVDAIATTPRRTLLALLLIAMLVLSLLLIARCSPYC